jgi:hypothetical protein
MNSILLSYLAGRRTMQVSSPAVSVASAAEKLDVQLPAVLAMQRVLSSGTWRRTV